MNQKSQREKASRRGQSGIEYDLGACDLAFLEALLHASPSPEMREAFTERFRRGHGLILDLGRSAHSDLRVRKRKRQELLASLMNKELIPAASPQTAPSVGAVPIFARRGKRVDHAKSVLFGLSQIARNHFIG